MKVLILDTKRNKEVVGEISIATKPELPLRNGGWSFHWRSLVDQDSVIYKLSYESEIQGLLKMTQVDEGFYEMRNLELSFENYGSKGRFAGKAGCLIAYACMLTFKLNTGPYLGFLSFTSKGALIKHYAKHYHAELVYREKMIIFPANGKKLIAKYLKIEI